MHRDFDRRDAASALITPAGRQLKRYRVQNADDSPQRAASKDFAFCAAFYKGVALSLPESDKTLEGQSLFAAMKNRALSYAKVAVALTNAAEFKANVSEANRYFSSLTQEMATRKALQQEMKDKCRSIESRHSEVLATLSKKMQGEDAVEAKFAASLYADSVSQKVLRVMTTWPSSDDGMRLVGSVTVQITISEDGSLVEAVPRTSGEGAAKLGSDIVQKVSAAAPFLPPPKSTLNKQGQFQFLREFTYSVRKEEVPRPHFYQPRIAPH